MIGCAWYYIRNLENNIKVQRKQYGLKYHGGDKSDFIFIECSTSFWIGKSNILTFYIHCDLLIHSRYIQKYIIFKIEVHMIIHIFYLLQLMFQMLILTINLRTYTYLCQ